MMEVSLFLLLSENRLTKLVASSESNVQNVVDLFEIKLSLLKVYESLLPLVKEKDCLK